MRDPQADVARIRDEVARSSGRFHNAQGALTSASAKDSTGAVTVTLDAAGRITSIVTSMTWRSSYSARTLANGINEAVGTAMASQLNEWGNAVVDDHAASASAAPATLSREPGDDLVDTLDEVMRRNPADRPEAAMQTMRDMLQEMVDSIDQVQAQIQAHLDREYEGRSGSGKVKALVLGNGTLVDLTMDSTWTESAHPANIGREATQAVQDAYRRIGEGGVQSILADSPMGRIDRLSKDPVALAQTFGLSR